ncbi:MAG: hypothetical protein ACI86M_000104 [Saprospiraceae bacterium]
MDQGNNNLFEEGSFSLESFKSVNGVNVEFTIIDFVVKDSNEKFHLETLDGEFLESLIDTEKIFLLTFSDGSVDTLLFGIGERDGKCRNTFKNTRFNYNGLDLLGSLESTIGAYILRK